VWQEFEVVEKKIQTKRITSFTLERPGEGEELDPGIFALLKLPNGLIRPYSIVGGTTNRFQLGVAIEENSRGGSRYLHEELKQGDKILVGKFTESVPITGGASNHIFIAGVSPSGVSSARLQYLYIFSQVSIEVWHFIELLNEYADFRILRESASLPFYSMQTYMAKSTTTTSSIMRSDLLRTSHFSP
jgi:hypothetical protein